MYQRNTPHTLESLLARTKETNGCFVWQGAKTSSGYGVSTYRGVQTTAHRVAFLLTHPDFRLENEVHHTCRNRSCINPEHLQETTRAENHALDREARTTCRAGHEWTPENTYVTIVKRKQGGTREQRYCRECRAKHQADLRTKRRQ